MEYEEVSHSIPIIFSGLSRAPKAIAFLSAIDCWWYYDIFKFMRVSSRHAHSCSVFTWLLSWRSICPVDLYSWVLGCSNAQAINANYKLANKRLLCNFRYQLLSSDRTIPNLVHSLFASFQERSSHNLTHPHWFNIALAYPLWHQ